MSDVIMYGAARPLPDDAKGPAKVRMLGAPVIVTGPAPTGDGADTTYETKIILPSGKVFYGTATEIAVPVEPAPVDDAPAADAAPVDDAPDVATEAPAGRRSGR